MPRRALALLILSGCTEPTDCPVCDTTAADTDTGDDTGEPAESEVSWLMFQDAQSVQFSQSDTLSADCAAQDGLWSGSMTLLQVDPEVLWFTDRPEHSSFNMPVETFVSVFPELFADAPPNAVVSWDEVAGAGRHIVVQLDAPVLDGEDLTYTACAIPLSDPDTLEPLPESQQYIPPEQPAHVGTISVFIDNATADVGALYADDTPDDTVPPVYLAFSGGGWHSHTALSGWMAGMLDASGGDLAALLVNVDAISSNSGGSWFLTQLTWSSTFRTALEDERDDWLTTGYIGQTSSKFDTAHPCDGWNYVNYALCSSVTWTQPYYEMMELADSSTLSWQIFVENVVYRPFDMSTELAGVTLSSPRQPWAEGRDLIIAASLLTDDVVLNEDKSGYVSSWVQTYRLRPTSAGTNATQNFTPLFFSSIDGTNQPPDLLGTGEQKGTWKSSWSSARTSETMAADHPADVPVIDAAVASSAAPAAIASEKAAGEAGWSALSSTASYLAADLAPPIELTDDGVSFITTVADYTGSNDTTYTNLAARHTLRTADGGYLDNTSLAYLLQHLDNNGLLVDDTSLVLFMNSSSPGVAAGTQTIPESVAVLFGYNPDPSIKSYTEPATNKAIKFCDEGYCFSTFSAHVFDASAWSGAEAVWSHSDGDVALRYYALPVTTVDNSTFGITAGTSLTLHLFINEDFHSSALPSSQAIMDSYSDVYTVTRAGVSQEGGWGYLAAALGLQQ
jgi:hypothetical protein